MKSPFRTVLLAALSAVVLYACGSSGSSASSGLSQSDVQAMISAAVTPLQSQIAALQTQVSGLGSPAVFIKAPNAPAIALKAQQRSTSQKTTPPTCSGLGTLTGRPENSDPIASNDLSGVSCAGYYFTVSGAATTADTAIVQPLQGSLTVWFDAPNCTGNAYVELDSQNQQQGISAGALANGAVFRVYLNGADNPSDASSYWMLKPGTVKSDPMLMSAWQNEQCGNNATVSFDLYQLTPNDSTVSGVPSAPIQGPVTIG